MFSSFFRFFKELDQRVKIITLGTGLYAWDFTLPQQYNMLYASALGINPFILGTLSSIGRALNSIISIPIGWVADRYGVKKAVLIGLAIFTLVAGSYAFAFDQRLIIPALILGSISIVYPFTDIIIINYTKPQQRTMVMAFARTIWAIPNIFIPMIAALIVTNFGGITIEGIRPLYYIQLALALFLFLFVVVKLQTPSAKSTESRNAPKLKRNSFIQDFIEMFKGEKHLKKWLILQTIFWFSQFFAMPFTSLWMVNIKGADPYILGAMLTVSQIMSTILQIPVGRLADKIGRKKVFFILRPLTYLGTLLLIMAPSPEYLILIGILGGVGMIGAGGGGIGGVSFIPFITMNFEMVPAEKRGRWRGVTSIFNLISFPVSILGGIMWQQGLMIEVMLIPILAEILIMIPIMITVPDTLGRSKK